MSEVLKVCLACLLCQLRVKKSNNNSKLRQSIKSPWLEVDWSHRGVKVATLPRIFFNCTKTFWNKENGHFYFCTKQSKMWFTDLSITMAVYLQSLIQCTAYGIMGRRFPDGGLLRYRKWVPQQLGDVIKQGSGGSRPMAVRHGDMAAWQPITRTCIIFAVRAWSAVVYLLSRRGRTCEI